MDCLSSVSIDDVGDVSFCSGVMSALLDGERDRRRVRLDPDGVRGLRSRGDGVDESLRFVLCSRLVRLRCIVVIDGAVVVVLRRLRLRLRRR